MIPFDSLCLAAVVSELSKLVGARVQKVWQTGDTTVVISLYWGSERLLLLSADATFARTHLVSRRPDNPGKSGLMPPPFCQALRKYLGDGKLEMVRQRGFDRIIELGFSGEFGDVMLVGEFMGKHSNLMLVGPDRKLLGAAKWVGPKQSRRPILPAKLYEPPPFDPKPSLLKAKPGEEFKGLEGASPFLLKLIDAGFSLDQIKRAVKEDSYGPVYSPGNGAYPVPLDKLGLPQVAKLSISQALDASFTETVQRTAITGARDSLLGQLKRVLGAREKALESLALAKATADQAGSLQKQGELILACQGTIQPGDSQVDVYDYEGNLVTLPLRPDETAVENANRLFDKAKKAKGRKFEIEEQYDHILREIEELSDSLVDLEQAETKEAIDELREIATKRRWLSAPHQAKKKEERPFEGHPIRELTTPGGYRLLFGTNATSNDYLTTKYAKPSDLWFHVRGQTSSHVILVTGNQPDKVPQADLHYAALIAARHSVAKHSSYVPVDYTLKKYVRKPRGSAAGFASYVNEKTLHVDP